MPKITYNEDNQEQIVVQQRGTILEAALHNNIEHYHVCGGKARCITCRFYILNGCENLAPRTEAEMKIAQEKKWSDNIRLACQTKVLGDVTIKRLVVDDVDVDLARSEGKITKPANEHSLAVMFCDVENFTHFAATHLHNTSHNGCYPFLGIVSVTSTCEINYLNIYIKRLVNQLSPIAVILINTWGMGF
jgi:ferredoxin